MKIVQKHLGPRPLITAEKFGFCKRNQLEGEFISSFVKELQKLSEHCNCKDELNEALRQVFVWAGAVQRKLLTKE